MASPPGGVTRIVENRQGIIQAAAGVDASNTPPGTVLLLPEDPDASARLLCGAAGVGMLDDRRGKLGETPVALVRGLGHLVVASCGGSSAQRRRGAGRHGLRDLGVSVRYRGRCRRLSRSRQHSCRAEEEERPPR